MAGTAGGTLGGVGVGVGVGGTAGGVGAGAGAPLNASTKDEQLLIYKVQHDGIDNQNAKYHDAFISGK